MASAELSRRVGKAVAYPPLSELSDLQRREFHDALLEADTFEDLPGKWQAAILSAEDNRAESAGRQRRLGIDDISVRVFYRPSWLFVPGT